RARRLAVVRRVLVLDGSGVRPLGRPGHVLTGVMWPEVSRTEIEEELLREPLDRSGVSDRTRWRGSAAGDVRVAAGHLFSRLRNGGGSASLGLKTDHLQAGLLPRSSLESAGEAIPPRCSNGVRRAFSVSPRFRACPFHCPALRLRE